MPLNPGTNENPADFTESSSHWVSMVAAMEYAFKTEWPKVMKNTQAPSKDEELNQMRLLFAAVAQGVVNYLKEHPEDFKVIVDAPGIGEYTGTVSKIE